MFTLRDYQTDIIQELYNHISKGSKRPLVVLPTGSGKTVVFAWLAHQMQKKIAIDITPESATNTADSKPIWFLVHRRELLDQTIATFKAFDIPMDHIYISMVISAANKLNNLQTKPSVIVFDEAHHSSAATWRRIVDACPDAFLIGLTATPCRLDGKPLKDIYSSMVLGVTTTELIDRGYLAKYKYYAPAVADLSSLRRKGADFDADQAGELLSKPAVYGDVIKHWKQYANDLQTIIYCSSIKHSKSTAEAFNEAGIYAVHFDGETPTHERRQIVLDFRAGKIKVLCNVDLIGEGFDVPDCWCCVLLRPTASTGLYIQQAGRALRPQEGKTAIILDHVGNYTRHGLPDDQRVWSLEENLKPHEQYREDGILTVRQCPECYATFASGPDVCPYCGAFIRKTREEIKNIKAIHLEEVKQRQREVASETAKGKTVDQCYTLMELQAWAKENGKKPGYAWYIWKGRRNNSGRKSECGV